MSDFFLVCNHQYLKFGGVHLPFFPFPHRIFLSLISSLNCVGIFNDRATQQADDASIQSMSFNCWFVIEMTEANHIYHRIAWRNYVFLFRTVDWQNAKYLRAFVVRQTDWITSQRIFFCYFHDFTGLAGRMIINYCFKKNLRLSFFFKQHKKWTRWIYYYFMKCMEVYFTIVKSSSAL